MSRVPFKSSTRSFRETRGSSTICDGSSESVIYAESGSADGGGGAGDGDFIYAGRGFESGVLRRNEGEAIYGVGESAC